MHHLLMVTAIVMHHRQQWNPVVCSSPEHTWRVHHVAIGLEVDRESSRIAVGQRRSYRGRRPIANSVTARATNVVIVLFHGPQLTRPTRQLAVASVRTTSERRV